LDKFLTLLVSGAVAGGIYSLVASGLTLSYSATGIFNFAYGGIAFAAAYLFYILNSGLHWPTAAAAVVVIVLGAPLLGLVLDVAVFRPLARATESAKIMATIGLLLAIPALTEWICDGVVDIFHVSIPTSSDVLQAGFPPGLGPTPQRTWHLPGNIPINSNELAVLISAAVGASALWFLLRRTTLGLQMRAVVDRHTLARMRGINDLRTSRYAWVIGTMFAALAGVAAAPIIGSISTSGYLTITFVSAAAAVLGGLRSIPLAFAGGILLGVIQDMVTGYVTVNIQGFSDSVPVVVLLVALMLGARDRSRRGGQTADDTPPPDYLSRMPLWRRAAPWVAATVFLVVYVCFLASGFWAGVMAQGLALSIIFLSFVLVTGMGGMVSLAQAAFCSAAGLATGLLVNQYHVSFFLAALAALAITALIGAVVALPALRLGGLPLALATLALALLGDNVLFQWNYLDNSSSGWTLPRPTIGPIHLTSNREFAMAMLVIVLLIMVLISNLKRSPWGRAIAAVRSSEIAAATSGVAPIRIKLGLFALSAVVAGLGGIFYDSFQTSASSSATPAIDGLLWLATVVLFGIRRPAAAALAGVASATSTVIIQSGFHWWSWVPSWLSWNGTQSTEIPLILFGLGAVGLARDPDGFISHTAAQRHLRRQRRLARNAATNAGLPAGVADATEVGAAAILAEAEELTAEAQSDVAELIGSGALGRPGPSDDGVPVDDVLLRIDDLRVSHGDVEALHGVSLTVRKGRITCVFGVNGSGKSTLCSTVAGLLTPTSGSVVLDGTDMGALPAYDRVDLGVLVAPESRGVFPGLTVDENLALRLDGPERTRVFERFPNLGARRSVEAGSLSGGEQQMLALAPVVVRPPTLVIVDEPTLGLAPLVIADLLDLFVQLRDLGTTIMLVEEKVRDVLSIADDVAFIERGVIAWSGPRVSLHDEQVVAAYLGAAL
jgi:ABC-type branched-subunit amino acid transport system ATPase component/branched-subunit amino acid ABC-type transport system permease component